MLKPDGSVNLSSGISGSFDATGWRMEIGAGGTPRFEPATATANRSASREDVYWDDRFPAPSVNYISALLPDGAGGLYAAGEFTIGGPRTSGVAYWNGSSWSLLGALPGGWVTDFAMIGSNLYACGGFSTIGGVAANNIAKWDGSSWSSLGAGTTFQCYALAAIGTDLYVGAPGQVLKWNGSSWTQSWSVEGLAFQLAAIGNDLYLGGSFDSVDGVAASCLAKWNGSVWAPVGGGTNGAVHILLAHGTDLYAGGTFGSAGGASARNIAKWNGSSWSALGEGVADWVEGLAAVGDQLYAGCYSDSVGVMRWNGTSWSQAGSRKLTWCKDLKSDGGVLYYGGCKEWPLLKWDGAVWSGVGTDLDGPVTAVAVNGTDFYAGGHFTAIGGVRANGVAKWNGTSWSALGTGVGDSMTGVRALEVSGNDLYAGGDFLTAGGVPVNGIAKWNGAAWSALGRGVSAPDGYCVYAIQASGSNVYAGGSFASAGGTSARNIAQWDGSSWHALGSGTRGAVYALEQFQGKLYAGGSFDMAGGRTVNAVAVWNGASWSAVGHTPATHDSGSCVNALLACGNDLFVGGSFSRMGDLQANNTAIWDGSSWSRAGTDPGPVYAFANAGGTVYAAGAGGVLMWTEAHWLAVGSGFDSAVVGLAASGRSLLCCGSFSTAGNKPSFGVAQLEPRVNVTTAALSASPGAMTIGNDVYGFHKPAVQTNAGTLVTSSAGLPAEVTVDQAPEIEYDSRRINGAFSLMPAGVEFGGTGANVRVEFSEDDVAAYPGMTPADFRAAEIVYPSGYPAGKEALGLGYVGSELPVPVRIENGRQIYAVNAPVMLTGAVWGAVPITWTRGLADLAVTITDAPDPVKAGAEVLYTLTVANAGPSQADNVRLQYTQPAGTTLVSATSTQGTVQTAGDLLTALLGAVPAGGTATLYVRLIPQAPCTLVNQASVGCEQADPVPANNSVVEYTTVVNGSQTDVADLAGQWVELSASERRSRSGSTWVLKGKLIVTNTGGQNAPGTRVRYYLSNDPLLDAQDRSICEGRVRPVRAGSSATERLCSRLNSGVTPQGMYVLALLDSDSQLPPGTESDNLVVYGPLP